MSATETGEYVQSEMVDNSQVQQDSQTLGNFQTQGDTLNTSQTHTHDDAQVDADSSNVADTLNRSHISEDDSSAATQVTSPQLVHNQQQQGSTSPQSTRASPPRSPTIHSPHESPIRQPVHTPTHTQHTPVHTPTQAQQFTLPTQSTHTRLPPTQLQFTQPAQHSTIQPLPQAYLGAAYSLNAHNFSDSSQSTQPTQHQPTQHQPTQHQPTQQYVQHLQPRNTQASTPQAPTQTQTHYSQAQHKVQASTPQQFAQFTHTQTQYPQTQTQQQSQPSYTIATHYATTAPYTLASTQDKASTGVGYSSGGRSMVPSTYSSNYNQHTALSTWSNTRDSNTAGTKENPLHINEFAKVLHRLALSPATTGTQGAHHYTLKIMHENIASSSDGKLIVNNSNSSSVPTYYVDISADIASSRSSSMSLQTSGYYELRGVPINISSELPKIISEKIETLRDVVGPDAIRLPVYATGSGEVMFRPRLFEFYPGKNKDKDPMEVYASDSATDFRTVRKISIASDEYKNYSGKIRVIGTFTVITVANKYVKLVFTGRTLILAADGVKLIGGLELSKDSPPSRVDANEWNSLQQLLRELVDSGVPLHMIRRVVEEGIDNRIKLATSDSTYRPSAPLNTTSTVPTTSNVPSSVHIQHQQHTQQQNQQAQGQQPIQHLQQLASVYQLPQQNQNQQQSYGQQQNQQQAQLPSQQPMQHTQQPMQHTQQPMQHTQQQGQQFYPMQHTQQQGQQFQQQSGFLNTAASGYPPLNIGNATQQFTRR